MGPGEAVDRFEFLQLSSAPSTAQIICIFASERLSLYLKYLLPRVNMGDTILIDIGGTIFRTSKSTLCSVDGYFAAMFRSGIWAEETTKNPIFIDRDPTTFPSILSYLRSQKAIFSDKEDDTYLYKLQVEADYYQLVDLQFQVQLELQRRQEVRSKGNETDSFYKIVKGTEITTFLNQGWQFVHQYYGNETFGCIASGTRMETIWFGNHCVACNELMNLEKFLKHTTLFQPVMFVIVKKGQSSSVSTEVNPVGTLSFDQSFG